MNEERYIPGSDRTEKLLLNIHAELQRLNSRRRWEYYWVIVNQAQPAPGFLGTKWEIETAERGKLKGDAVWDYIDEAGDEGWELVSVVPLLRPSFLADHGSITGGWCLWFKRPF